MKIGILTFHLVSNQGALLQCYALKSFLEKQGHTVQVIDYCPQYLTVQYSRFKNPFVFAGRLWKLNGKQSTRTKCFKYLLDFARCMRMNLDRSSGATWEQFEKFRENLDLTRKYRTLEELRADPPACDAYICGSDQLWNPELLDQVFDRAYFLDFGDEKTLRISYAVSMGKDMSGGEVAELKQLCSGLTAVSLREYHQEAVAATGRDVHICIDPTLLLNAEDYLEAESKARETEPYIFVYGFETNDAIRQAVETAEKKYGCRVINGSPARVKLGERAEAAKDYGPDQFLTYIKNARCVVTNSFHGTALSIVYQKDFIVVPHTTRGRRMTELLAKLGLRCRLWNDETFSFEQEIDYVQAGEKLEVLRNCSFSYLTEALSGKRGEEIPHHPAERPAAVRSPYADWKAYYGWNKDTVQLKQSASGGGSAIIAEAILQQNGVVFGVAYAPDFRSAGYVCAESVDELAPMKGSKYIYSGHAMLDGTSVYDAIEEKLRAGRTVLVTGVGCFIAGVKRRMELHGVDTDRLYTIDLICHGPTLPSVQNAYIEALEKKFSARVVAFSSRHKKRGWTPPYIHAEFENGKVYDRPLYESDFGYAFKTYSRPACYHCHFKGNGHAADLTLGDFWGVQPGMKEYNHNGVSIFLCKTDKGRRMVEMIDRERFLVDETEMERAVRGNPMFEKSLSKPGCYEAFEEDFKQKGLHYAVVHSKGYRRYVEIAIRKRLKELLIK